MKTFSVNEGEKGHSFVKGNTKYLSAMNQDELEILANNGDPRVKVEGTDDKPAEVKKGAKPAPTAEPAA